MLKYQNILLCGGIYASGINGLTFFKKHFEVLRNKNIAIFCVGASPYDEKLFEEIKMRNLKVEMQNIPIYYGREVYFANQNISQLPCPLNLKKVCLKLHFVVLPCKINIRLLYRLFQLKLNYLPHKQIL